MPDIIIILIVCAIVFYLLSVPLSLSGRGGRAADVPAGIGLLLVFAAAFCLWLETQRLPVYGRLESGLHIALVLAVCVEFFGRRFNISDSRPWGRLLVCLLLGTALLGGKEWHPDFYMYRFFSVQLFFFLRLSAGGVLAFSFLFFAQSWLYLALWRRNNTVAGMRVATHFLILGAGLFLCAEFAGTIWCSLGYGDTWHWSRNFFKSAAMFMLLMLPLHVPRFLRKNVRLAGAGSLCTLWVVLEIAR